jgi:hypothetical protein
LTFDPDAEADEDVKPRLYGVYKGVGLYWGSASPRYTYFSTILPPNSPSSCYSGEETRHVMVPSSFHHGGVVASRLDGSVVFISDTIDCGSSFSKKVSENTGQSLYGIWGAVGSIAGDEISQP